MVGWSAKISVGFVRLVGYLDLRGMSENMGHPRACDSGRRLAMEPRVLHHIRNQ